MNEETERLGVLYDALEWAWTIIANAGGGDWKRESKDWQKAAAKWRDATMPHVARWAAARAPTFVAPPTTEPPRR